MAERHKKHGSVIIINAWSFECGSLLDKLKNELTLKSSRGNAGFDPPN
jgi:hypothetical protein